jgi:UDP-N-acetylmuramate-alanine ligase
VEKINRENVRFAVKLSDVTDLLLQELRSDDVVIVLSAGDANQINSQMLKTLSEKEKK